MAETRPSESAQAKSQRPVLRDWVQAGFQAHLFCSIEQCWEEPIRGISHEDHCSLLGWIELLEEGL
jgi:hypothetical protein